MPIFDIPAHAVEYPGRTQRHLQYLRGSNMGDFPGNGVGAIRSSPVQD